MGSKYLEPKKSILLDGKLLIATPYLNGSIFEKVIIFVCAHDEDGSLGIILNKPEGTLSAVELCKLLKIKNNRRIHIKFDINYGGPVNEKNLFVLSRSNHKAHSNYEAPISLYTNAEGFLADIMKNKNKSEFILVRGFCGWGPNQLEEEIRENSWILADADFKTLFAKHSARSWEKIIKKLGITDFDKIVGYTGTA